GFWLSQGYIYERSQSPVILRCFDHYYYKPDFFKKLVCGHWSVKKRQLKSRAASGVHEVPDLIN
ncbi:hypothetical protein, partial [Chamaesiphon sp. OTE_75_metabat_556]|uniref:hypothetical protein n=1 Tax=Chamaesiphon sp. OTE_75_metabat_556 TaxID=2964692 RepID=UPI00286D4F26